MSIIIEKASPADAAQLLEYLKQIGRETDNLTFGEEGLPFSVEEEAGYIASMENSSDNVMLLAKDNGRIIGDASLSRMPRRMSHRGDLGMTVLKEYWNQGIGGQLMRELIAFAKENAFSVIDLQVRCDNLPAIHLYEKFGFQTIGIHPSFMEIDGNSVAAMYMYLKIQ